MTPTAAQKADGTHAAECPLANQLVSAVAPTKVLRSIKSVVNADRS